MGKIEEATDLGKKYYETLSEIKEEDVFALFRPLFEEYPQLRAIGWKQYVPSFNDGDPCTFRMGEFLVVVDNENLAEMEDEDFHDNGIHELDSYVNWGLVNAIPGLEDAVSSKERFITYDLAERVFGSDAQVIITKEKLTSREYDCGY